MLILRLDPEDDPSCPNDWGHWKFVSFQTRDPDSIRGERENYLTEDGEPINGALAMQLKHGTAFKVDLYRHSADAWSLHGEGVPKGVLSGILIWNAKPRQMGAKTYKERAAQARNFMDYITKWVNGWVHCYLLTDENNPSFEHRGGDIYDPEEMAEEIRAIVKGRDLKISGPGAWLAKHHDFKGKSE
jgi:hypothetical protein